MLLCFAQDHYPGKKNTVCTDSGSDLRLQNVVDVGNSDDRPLQQLSDG